MIAPNRITVQRRETPLILAMPHGGTFIPSDMQAQFVSPWMATRDADWHIAELYDGLAEATIISTSVSRSVIDVNRDPSGASLYPGQATTELCPTTTFDGEPLYRQGANLADNEIAERRAKWFAPYHAALQAEIERLRKKHSHVVIYDCHSIRSHIPRLFHGILAELNIGTNGGTSCDPALCAAVAEAGVASQRSAVVDGRFRGGWTTRHYGRPSDGIHAIQMELAMRAYLREPDGPIDPGNWPPAFDSGFAGPLRADLARILSVALNFAKGAA